MAVDAIGAAGSATSSVPANAGIAQEDFLRILLAQLRFQDPLKPVDNQQFVAQLAQFSALEINRQQSEKIDRLLSMQAADQAVGLIGKQVEVRNAQGGSSVGTVAAISFRSGEPQLTLTSNGTTLVDVSLADILLIRQ
ncbi:MAG TPA: flagellar hook capping FlgD N-terminal domain-containing protein [Steroidobacteraceae bacterium]|jgi:flagellar basal-body rod modification protein FlgD|nr:flagellar hook capping FlgD N-terminal domain-containing protein [Steroidobacteraceae bacterium]